MKRRWIVGVSAVLLAVPVLAQDMEPQGRDRQDVRRGDRRRGDGERGDRQRGARQRGGMRRMLDRVGEQLDLDDSQREKLDQIVESRSGDMDRRRELGQQMREARESGDDARLEELREQMRGGGGRNPFEAILNELEPVLREDQLDSLDEMRQNFGRRGGRNQQGLDRRSIERLGEDLNLSSEQTQKFDEIIANYNERRGDLGGRMREMGGIWRELREARQAGDERKAEELQAKLAEIRPDRQASTDRLFNQIERILNNDQKKILEEARQRMGSRGDRRGRGRQPDVREILRAAKRLRLDDDQKAELREIERDAQRDQRELSARDREAQAELTQDVKKEILKILDDDQKRQFERSLNSSDRRGGRRGGERGERGARRGQRGERRPTRGGEPRDRP